MDHDLEHIEFRDETLERALRALSAEDNGLDAPAAVEQVVRQAYRDRNTRGRLLAYWAAAAALVVGISAALPWPARHPASPAPVVAEQPAEVGTDYFPLRAGPVLDPGEMGHVIRVPAPQAMLARFGLNRGGGVAVPASADVLIGLDGTARAVRFVH